MEVNDRFYNLTILFSIEQSLAGSQGRVDVSGEKNSLVAAGNKTSVLSNS